jgi:uncharacterized protein (TIGR00299 family) protein
MILYLDCSNGVAGDMLTAALADVADRCGLAAADVVSQALARAGVEHGVAGFESTRRGGFAARRFVVQERSGFASFEALEAVVRSSALPPAVIGRVLAIAGRMAAAEAAVHGQSGAHLHELAGLDTAVDLIAAASLVEVLGPARVVASPPALGGGEVRSAHGPLAVPAPAVLALLEGLPTAGGDGPGVGELTTPTGAALLAELVHEFGPLPAGRIVASGCGAGSRELPGRANVLRAVWLEPPAEAADPHGGAVELLEATIDDATPELLGHAADQLRVAGALDVWITPALMKKGRPGHVLHVLARVGDASALAETVFRETTTFGLRVLPAGRIVLEERREAVEVAGASIGVRLGYLGGRLVTASPEFEDCRRGAAAAGLPVAEVYAAAQAAAYGRFGAA